MNQPIPKFDPRTGRPASPHPEWLGPLADEPSPTELAGWKAHARYQRYRCEKFLKKRDPQIDCSRLDVATAGGATAEPDDRFRELADTWIAKGDRRFSLDSLPTRGAQASDPWSGDYWRANHGFTSYRYSSGVKYEKWRDAVDAYAQPDEWKGLANLPLAELAAAVVRWSPAEKYDLAVGDLSFQLTREQKQEGETLVGPLGKIEPWMGLCHGWAPASLFVPNPRRSAVSTGPGGVAITWYPDDIRALASLAWSNGNFDTNFIGGRCNAEKARVYPNGRLRDVECFDTNPSSLHLALANFLGRQGIPFLADAIFDAEVWNQPIVEYQFRYFDPTDPTRMSDDWRDVGVDYDDAFKARDRFQSPLTRGRRKANGSHDDRGISKIVGVAATVVYLDTYDAAHAAEPAKNVTLSATYTYDLELHEKNGRYYPMGGEWHENAHPDFLWVPRRGDTATLPVDERPLGFRLDTPAPEAMAGVAAGASRKEGYPLCEVVRALVEASSGGSYACR